MKDSTKKINLEEIIDEVLDDYIYRIEEATPTFAKKIKEYSTVYVSEIIDCKYQDKELTDEEYEFIVDEVLNRYEAL